MADPIRLTDAQALRQLSAASRWAVKRYGLLRCLRAPNAWHVANPKSPDYGNSSVPHFEPCRCRASK